MMNDHVDRAFRFVYAALSSLYLFTLGAFSRRHRPLISTIAAHFGYHRLGVRPTVPKIALAQVGGADAEVQLRAIEALEGNVTLPELVAIVQLVKAQQAAYLFEIGTFDGRTTLNMAINAAENAVVYTLDLPRRSINSTALQVEDHERHLIDKAGSGARFLTARSLASRIHQLWGDSATFDYSPHAGRCDFVFIDGSHAYDYVVNDSEVALRLIGESGTIVWHDYGEWPGVTAALNTLFSSDARFTSLRCIAGTTLAFLTVSRDT